jgi:hypothetical protein
LRGFGSVTARKQATAVESLDSGYALLHVKTLRWAKDKIMQQISYQLVEKKPAQNA